MGKLSSTDLKWLEDRFASYTDYEMEIHRRRFELNYRPENQTPEIQKTPSQKSQTESFVIKIMTDDYINDRERWKRGVETVFHNANEDIKEMIQVKFIDYPYLSWEEAGDRLHHSKSKAYRMRYKILRDFAKAIKYR